MPISMLLVSMLLLAVMMLAVMVLAVIAGRGAKVGHGPRFANVQRARRGDRLIGPTLRASDHASGAPMSWLTCDDLLHEGQPFDLAERSDRRFVNLISGAGQHGRNGVGRKGDELAVVARCHTERGGLDRQPAGRTKLGPFAAKQVVLIGGRAHVAVELIDLQLALREPSLERGCARHQHEHGRRDQADGARRAPLPGHDS